MSRLYAGGILGSTTAPVRTDWSASDPCAISGYTLERRVSGGGWGVQGLPAATTTSVRQALRVGTTYRYVANASDGAGNRSSWVYGPFFEPLVTQQSSTAVRYTGAWKTASSSSYSGGSTRYATGAGAAATYTFRGCGIAWVAGSGPTRGSARVYIDGVYAVTVNLHATTTTLRRVAYASNWTGQGVHTIRIVALGTAGHPRVDLDAFVRMYRP